MPLGRACSIAVRGIDGQVVEIEADIGQGLPSVHLVGLPDTSLQESRDRVRAAVANTGEKWPDGRVILALSPATLPNGVTQFRVIRQKWRLTRRKIGLWPAQLFARVTYARSRRPAEPLSTPA